MTLEVDFINICAQVSMKNSDIWEKNNAKLQLFDFLARLFHLFVFFNSQRRLQNFRRSKEMALARLSIKKLNKVLFFFCPKTSFNKNEGFKLVP